MQSRIREEIERWQNHVLRADLDVVLCVKRSFCRVRSTSLILSFCMLCEDEDRVLFLGDRFYLHIVWWFDHLKGLYGLDMAVLISKSV
jgi:hypothetical protein